MFCSRHESEPKSWIYFFPHWYITWPKKRERFPQPCLASVLGPWHLHPHFHSIKHLDFLKANNHSDQCAKKKKKDYKLRNCRRDSNLKKKNSNKKPELHGSQQAWRFSEGPAGWLTSTLKPRNSKENQWHVVMLLQTRPWKRLVMDPRCAGSHQLWGQPGREEQADPRGDRGGRRPSSWEHPKGGGICSSSLLPMTRGFPELWCSPLA